MTKAEMQIRINILENGLKRLLASHKDYTCSAMNPNLDVRDVDHVWALEIEQWAEEILNS